MSITLCICRVQVNPIVDVQKLAVEKFKYPKKPSLAQVVADELHLPLCMKDAQLQRSFGFIKDRSTTISTDQLQYAAADAWLTLRTYLSMRGRGPLEERKVSAAVVPSSEQRAVNRSSVSIPGRGVSSSAGGVIGGSSSNESSGGDEAAKAKRKMLSDAVHRFSIGTGSSSKGFQVDAVTLGSTVLKIGERSQQAVNVFNSNSFDVRCLLMVPKVAGFSCSTNDVIVPKQTSTAIVLSFAPTAIGIVKLSILFSFYSIPEKTHLHMISR